MNRTTRMLAVAVALVLMALAISLPPVQTSASVTSAATVEAPATVISAAHVFDNYALWYCTKHSTSGHVILHATPYFLAPTQVRYYCRQLRSGVQHQYWVIVNLPLDSNESWRPWAYQRCHPGGIVTCLEP